MSNRVQHVICFCYSYEKLLLMSWVHSMCSFLLRICPLVCFMSRLFGTWRVASFIGSFCMASPVSHSPECRSWVFESHDSLFRRVHNDTSRVFPGSNKRLFQVTKRTYSLMSLYSRCRSRTRDPWSFWGPSRTASMTIWFPSSPTSLEVVFLVSTKYTFS